MMTYTPDPRVIELPNTGWDERVRLFRMPDEIDTSVITTDRYLVFIDTMTTPEQISSVIHGVKENVQDRQVLVVNTHADYDHAWGNAVFETPGGLFPAPIIAGAATAARLRSAEERDYLDERKRAEPYLANVRLVPPTIVVESGCTIDGGDLSLVLIPTPGHTADHMSVWLPNIGLLLAGDAAEHPYPYCGLDADIDVLLASISMLKSLQPSIVIPCHGGTTSPDLLDRNIAYFAKLDRIVRQAVNTRTLPAEWKTIAAPDEAIGYHFAQSIHDQGSDPLSISDFYKTSHVLAVQATIRRVLGGGQPL
jgi:glyoxylase-like metal-dependent hydrolase (beta-lactamase superfamily II)